MFNNILIVCIGNICRSPTAEYLLRHKLADRPGIKVSSVGLGALVDREIDPSAGELLTAAGIACDTHRARQARREHFLEADLILAMEAKHLRTIGDIAPQVSGKSFLLGKWSDNQEVPDPYRKSREAFEHVYGLLDRFTNDWLKYL